MAKQKKRPTPGAANFRPVAKALVKEALRVYDATKEALNKAGEQLEDLATEARKEMKAEKPSKSNKRHNS